MMENKLITESLKDSDNFSSNTHAIDTVASDVNTAGIKKYHIPEKYNENKIVLLPVNKTRYYFYWEFSSEFIHKNIIDLKEVFFHILDQEHNLIEVINCNKEFGQYFFEIKNKTPNIKSLQIIARYKHGVQLKHLLDSNIIKPFNNDIKIDTKDVWMTRQKGFTEVIRASMQHFTLGMSSKNYVDELSRLEEFEKLSKSISEASKESLSSHTLSSHSFSSHTVGERS